MELLKQLFSIYSPSGSEKKMKKFIKRYIRENIEGVEASHDDMGNLYLTKGKSDTYPCVVAHLDQVQDIHSKDFAVVEGDDVMFGFSRKNKRQEGLGADDKCGIWIAMKCLEHFDEIKVAFFVQEEVGCVGSSSCNMDFFKDVRFVIEPDRRGGSDLITSIGSTEIAGDDFINDTHYEEFGYHQNNGMLTDVLELATMGIGVSCVNISCGYYEPHTDHEFIVVSELRNALDFTMHIISNCKNVYRHECACRYSYGSWYNAPMYSRYLGGYDDKEEEIVVPKHGDSFDELGYIALLRKYNPFADAAQLWAEARTELEPYMEEWDFYEIIDQIDEYGI